MINGRAKGSVPSENNWMIFFSKWDSFLNVSLTVYVN